MKNTVTISLEEFKEMERIIELAESGNETVLRIHSNYRSGGTTEKLTTKDEVLEELNFKLKASKDYGVEADKQINSLRSDIMRIPLWIRRIFKAV